MQTGVYGWSLISQPATTGVHSSSRPTMVRIRRVLPCPRSPRRTKSCPASKAVSTSGSTVSSKPTIPGNADSPPRIRATRLARSSSLTVRNSWPDARSSASVDTAGGSEGEPDAWGGGITGPMYDRAQLGPGLPILWTGCESRRVPGFSGFAADAFAFYAGLEDDISKAYWTAHKKAYDEHVRDPMRALVAELQPEFGPGKLFRPNRDVRFSADKAPYKTHQGALVGP